MKLIFAIFSSLICIFIRLFLHSLNFCNETIMSWQWKFLMGMTLSLPSMWIWYTWELDCILKIELKTEIESKDFWVYFPNLLLHYKFLRHLGQEKDHSLSATSWSKIRTKGIGSHLDLCWKFGVPNWTFQSMMLLFPPVRNPCSDYLMLSISINRAKKESRKS